ncbi:MAG: hypothetical protein ACRD88_22410, partial [Terriglobia bacterium]
MRRLACVLLGAASVAYADKIAILLERAAGAPPRNALRLLEAGLKLRGATARRIAEQRDRAPGELLLALSIGSGADESFSVQKTNGSIAIRGADDRGLAYGIFELLGQVESAPPSASFVAAVSTASRAPGVK